MASWGLFAQDVLTASDIEKISDPKELDKFEHEVFLPISSTYKGKEKSCGYTRFPEEYTTDFKHPGKYSRLREYFELKKEVDQMKSLLDPNQDGEYSRRKREANESKGRVENVRQDFLNRVPMEKIRSKQIREILEDPEKFQKQIARANNNNLFIFPYEHPAVKEALIDAKIKNRVIIEDHKHFYNHFEDYRTGIEKMAKQNRERLPAKSAFLKEMEKDKEVMELASKIDPYELDEMFREQEAYKRSKNLTIVFEGTGQYSPMLERNLKILQAKLGFAPGQEAVEVANKKAFKISKDKGYFLGNSHKDTWSGTMHGPISEGLYANNEGEVNSRNSQWLYLPSENDQNLKPLMNLGSKTEMMTRKEAYSRGMQCLKAYLKEYPDIKLSILGHSSGVKAAIDFAEEIKKAGIKNYVQMFGIDPVNNMIDGGLEGAISGAFVRMDKIGNALTPDCWKSDEQKKREKANYVGVIQSRPQDELYKPSNASRFITYYQTQDMKGLEIPYIEFGIHGSPVKGAENKPITFRDDLNKHHGSITYQQAVVDDFQRMLAR